MPNINGGRPFRDGQKDFWYSGTKDTALQVDDGADGILLEGFPVTGGPQKVKLSKPLVGGQQIRIVEATPEGALPEPVYLNTVSKRGWVRKHRGAIAKIAVVLLILGGLAYGAYLGYEKYAPKVDSFVAKLAAEVALSDRISVLEGKVASASGAGALATASDIIGVEGRVKALETRLDILSGRIDSVDLHDRTSGDDLAHRVANLEAASSAVTPEQVSGLSERVSALEEEIDSAIAPDLAALIERVKALEGAASSGAVVGTSAATPEELAELQKAIKALQANMGGNNGAILDLQRRVAALQAR